MNDTTKANTKKCMVCKCDYFSRSDDDDGFNVCKSCIEKYPESLIKACFDPFNYCLKLTDGMEFVFESAIINGAYVHLELLPKYYDGDNFLGNEIRDNHKIERGIDIRVDAILWCYDMG